MQGFIPFLLLVGILSGCGEQSAAPGSESSSQSASAPTEQSHPSHLIGHERVLDADQHSDDWMVHGRSYDEQRHSPLTQISAENVDSLGLAWHFDLPTNRGLEATPIVIDGVMYVSGAWSMVYAFDAKTGDKLWFYDPKVDPAWAVNLCCDVVNRGVAVWQGQVFVGAIDGRLIALDAVTGKESWSIQTTDTSKPYSITGAPRVIQAPGRSLVVIGNGGGEYGVRGYVSAFDTTTGEQVWRFYTVPGNPELPFENEALIAAAETWGGGEWWKVGGGGTVWDSMAYDPELNLLYIGVGNGSPWNRTLRSPAGGDNLYLSSIVALHADTGEYAWHYQTTPGESWDYTATQHMILAELEIEGEARKVLMQAPKNGFFYVIDRVTGEFISAEKYTKSTWATHVDKETGRPVEVEGARYEKSATDLIYPGPLGGHNWHPMSYSPDTGLVYVPAQEIPWIYEADKDFVYHRDTWNTGTNIAAAAAPESAKDRDQLLALVRGHVSAWDPVKQQERWRIQHEGPWNGGILSTAGNVIFQGNAKGQFVAYSADEGKSLWSFPAQTGIVAAPITYRVDGEQYIAVMAGWGGSFALGGGDAADRNKVRNVSRLLTFKLGGEDELAPLVEQEITIDPPPLTADAATVAQGKQLFFETCAVCHGDGAVGGGVTPDLRAQTPEKFGLWLGVVLGGMHKERGMVSFASTLSVEEVEAIKAYVISRAHAAKSE